jgi:BT1 family
MQYLVFAVYSSLTELIAVPFHIHLQQSDEYLGSIYLSLLYVPWVLKPFYGLLSDWYHIFRYRIKGYVVILVSLNILVCLFLIISVDHLNLKVHFVLVLIVFGSLAFVDALARTLN